MNITRQNTKFIKEKKSEGNFMNLAKNCCLVRPLLSISRFEINKLCYFWRLPLYPDKSNKKVKFLRNRVRKQLLPAVKFFFNLRIENVFLQFADIVEAENQFLDKITKELFPKTNLDFPNIWERIFVKKTFIPSITSIKKKVFLKKIKSQICDFPTKNGLLFSSYPHIFLPYKFYSIQVYKGLEKKNVTSHIYIFFTPVVYFPLLSTLLIVCESTPLRFFNKGVAFSPYPFGLLRTTKGLCIWQGLFRKPLTPCQLRKPLVTPKEYARGVWGCFPIHSKEAQQMMGFFSASCAYPFRGMQIEDVKALWGITFDLLCTNSKRGCFARGVRTSGVKKEKNKNWKGKMKSFLSMGKIGDISSKKNIEKSIFIHAFFFYSYLKDAKDLKYLNKINSFLSKDESLFDILIRIICQPSTVRKNFSSFSIENKTKFVQVYTFPSLLKKNCFYSVRYAFEGKNRTFLMTSFIDYSVSKTDPKSHSLLCTNNKFNCSFTSYAYPTASQALLYFSATQAHCFLCEANRRCQSPLGVKGIRSRGSGACVAYTSKGLAKLNKRKQLTLLSTFGKESIDFALPKEPLPATQAFGSKRDKEKKQIEGYPPKGFDIFDLHTPKGVSTRSREKTHHLLFVQSKSSYLHRRCQPTKTKSSMFFRLHQISKKLVEKKKDITGRKRTFKIKNVDQSYRTKEDKSVIYFLSVGRTNKKILKKKLFTIIKLQKVFLWGKTTDLTLTLLNSHNVESLIVKQSPVANISFLSLGKNSIVRNLVYFMRKISFRYICLWTAKKEIKKNSFLFHFQLFETVKGKRVAFPYVAFPYSAKLNLHTSFLLQSNSSICFVFLDIKNLLLVLCFLCEANRICQSPLLHIMHCFASPLGICNICMVCKSKKPIICFAQEATPLLYIYILLLHIPKGICMVINISFLRTEKKATKGIALHKEEKRQKINFIQHNFFKKNRQFNFKSSVDRPNMDLIGIPITFNYISVINRSFIKVQKKTIKNLEYQYWFVATYKTTNIFFHFYPVNKHYFLKNKKKTFYFLKNLNYLQKQLLITAFLPIFLWDTPKN